MKAKEREQMAKERVTDSGTQTATSNTAENGVPKHRTSAASKLSKQHEGENMLHLQQAWAFGTGLLERKRKRQSRETGPSASIADHAESGTPGHNTSPNNTTETLQHNGATTTIAYKVRRVQQLPFVFAMRSDAICVDKPHVRAVYFDISNRDCDVPTQFAPKNLPA